nr:hypothetical protein [Tanacetum cinerariifolium]
MLISRVITLPASKLEQPQGDIFSMPLSPSLQMRRSLRKVKKHSLPPAPNLSSARRQVVKSPPPPPPPLP